MEPEAHCVGAGANRRRALGERPGAWPSRHMDSLAGSRTKRGGVTGQPEEREQNAGFAGGNAGDRSRGREEPWPDSCLGKGNGAAGKKTRPWDGRVLWV